MTAYTYIADLSTSTPGAPEESILSRNLLREAALDVTLFRFAAGQELSEHTASYPAVLHFLEGEADLKLGQDSQQARPGTWVYMPPHLPHSVHARTPVAMLLLLLKS
ncbi:MAG TPA: cupin domain-containing protein [Anaerolineales bacterium]|nr:cupin domain-containing protein [Anaerolineales bacterium]